MDQKPALIISEKVGFVYDMFSILGAHAYWNVYFFKKKSKPGSVHYDISGGYTSHVLLRDFLYGHKVVP